MGRGHGSTRAGGASRGGGGIIKGTRKTAEQLGAQVTRIMENTSLSSGLGMMKAGRYRKMALKAVQNMQKNILTPQGKAFIQNFDTGAITVGKLPKGMG